MRTVTLTPPAHKRSPTKIFVSSRVRSVLKDASKSLRPDRIVILYDEGIAGLAKEYAKSIRAPLLIAVDRGDASKSMHNVEKIIAEMLKHNCTRKTLLIAIGGGMVTDLGGFVASVFMRGITFILVPTTLLAMVDAAIGGKTAINVANRKNMAGTIAQPISVLVDTAVLAKLPQQQFREGLVEIVKIAAMTDAGFFRWLEDNMDAILKRDQKRTVDCIVRAIQWKVAVVQNDERDESARLLLNFGHTVGHAVEALSNYKLSHGAAVSIGIAAEMKIAKLSFTPRVTTLLGKLDMPLVLPAEIKPSQLWNTMLSDKKNEGANVRIAIPKTLGLGAVRVIKKNSIDVLFSHE